MKLGAALLAAVVLSKTHLKVTIACDNDYTLYLPGKDSIVGPKDGADGIQYGWANVKTHEAVLHGKGPWVVGIHGVDRGVISGMFAGITVNGKPYTATGFAHTKFAATLAKPELNWLDTNYNASSWKTGASLATADCTDDIWNKSSNGKFGPRFKAQMPEQDIKASWLPGCKTINNQVYFRVLITKPKKQCPPKH